MALSERIAVKILNLPLAQLEPAPYNAHVATQEALSGLAASLEEFGLISLPVVNRRPDGTYRIIGGHKRIETLKQKKEEWVECIVVEFDDETEKKANFALNNPAIQGEFVPELTRKVLDSLKTKIPPVLFSSLRLDKLVKSATRAITHDKGVDDVELSGKADDDAEVPVKTTAVSRVGTFYRLGDHVIVCGKVSNHSNFKRFGVDGADAAFTAIRGKGKPINPGFIDAHLHFLLTHTDGAIHIATDMTTLPDLQNRFGELGGHWSNTLIWFDPDAKPSNEIYRETTIPVLYGWRADGPHYFGGSNDQGNVFKLSKPPKTELPVEIVTKAIMNTTKAGQVVLDTDIGRGASIIAAQKVNRKLIGFVGTARETDATRARWAKFVHGEETNWARVTPEI